MKDNFTDITMILDRSGSMELVRSDTIGGFNSFLKTQREATGEAVLTLIQFNDKYEIICRGKNIKEVPELTYETFVPTGMTALLDAIGRTVDDTGVRLLDMNEMDRPSKVILVILTDGLENCSKKYSKEAIEKMIKHQSDVYQWDFVFIGANQDAIKTGASMGIPVGNSMTYAANSEGTKNAFASISTNLCNYRSSYTSLKKPFFSENDKIKQKELGA